ncbi:hypothetical protein U9M48_032891 [Paspalum notatum var. saurae]|uniref:Uncharacterized protein n=1 Tax=Paspalum notatum var. saurae TaxID=547442 RepID=A0AAQ3U6S0_PASNO
MVLDDFALATCLIINYSKTTFLPTGIDRPTSEALAGILHTPPYLGLPLTPHKVSVADFSPLIASCDRALPLHYMSALPIPKSVIKAIDGMRRAFFWTGDEKCHGSKCQVAWERVCKSKDEGGLGLKNLETQNHCLLMKFVDKHVHSYQAH